MSLISSTWRNLRSKLTSPDIREQLRDARDLVSRLNVMASPVLLREAPIFVIPQPEDEPFPVFNPSVCRCRSNFVFASRACNLIVTNDGTKRHYSSSSHVNANFLHAYEDLSRPPLVTKLDDACVRNGSGLGQFAIEDIRLFERGDEIWGIGCAVCMHNLGIYTTKQVLLQIQDGRINRIQILESPIGAQTEKNWMPLVHHGEIYFVYSVDPLVILKLEDGQCVHHVGELPQSNDFTIRGGTPFISFRRKYIALAHSKWMVKDGKSFYRHHFVVLNANLELDEISEPFFLKRRGIEFAAGLTEVAGDLLVSFGISDRRAAYAFITSAMLDEWIVI
ncbi:MAG: hypothetical protein R3D43_01220 [Tepidamorphaceae bacterium]